MKWKISVFYRLLIVADLVLLKSYVLYNQFLLGWHQELECQGSLQHSDEHLRNSIEQMHVIYDTDWELNILYCCASEFLLYEFWKSIQEYNAFDGVENSFGNFFYFFFFLVSSMDSMLQKREECSANTAINNKSSCSIVHGINDNLIQWPCVLFISLG